MESSGKQAVYIPISQDLVALVKRVDSFNVSLAPLIDDTTRIG